MLKILSLFLLIGLLVGCSQPPTALANLKPHIVTIYTKTYPVPVTHVYCGKVGWYATHILKKGELLLAKDFISWDGLEIKSGTIMQCSRCFKYIYNPAEELFFDVLEAKYER